MLEYRIGIQLIETVDQPFSGSTLTDDVIDATTIQFTLNEDFASIWSFRATHAQTQSPNINDESYDLSVGEDLYFKFQMFPKLSPWAVKYMIVQGANVKDIKFDYTAETIDITVQPTAAARTANHNLAGYGGLSIDFYYNGQSEDLDYSAPVIFTDAFLDDADRLSDLTPSGFKGTGFNIDGVHGEEVNFRFLLGERFVMQQGLQFGDLMGYLDGTMPPSGFQMSGPMDPEFSADLGDSQETFKVYIGHNINFSKRDIQLGVFPQPLSISGSSIENDGFHIMWNNDSGKTYTIESTDDLNLDFTETATGQSGPEYVDTTANGGSRYYRVKEE